MLKIEIDNQCQSVPSGTTILEAARGLGIAIPTLCHLKLEHLDVDHSPSSCRICVVEVEGRGTLAPACSTVCVEGMRVRSSSMRVLNARRTVLELLLSNHPKECLTCAKSGVCDLQRMAIQLGIREVHGADGAQLGGRRIDISSAIIRDPNKCIMCRRCETMCNDIQSVGALHASGRGFETVVAPAFNLPLSETSCTYCGQCVAVCPTGALTEVDHTQGVVRHLANPCKTVVVQTAPAVRAALGEEFGLEAGTLVTGKMVAALRRLGFDYVFDTDFAADLTVMEEGAELLSRLNGFLSGDRGVRLPILTSCCPAWVNFFETYYPDMLDVPSTARSPQQMFGAVAKNFFAREIGVAKGDMVVVSVMPCLAKKYECSRAEFADADGLPDVDFALSTRELARLIREANINFAELPDEEFDSPLGASSGAAALFGTTGGVMEAALRTAYELHTGESLEIPEFMELRGFQGVRLASVVFGDMELRVGIAHGLGNARKLLDKVRAREIDLHAIEIMACPGGCIGGAGQPLHHGNEQILRLRQQALYREDQNTPLRKSHENPYIQALYKEFLGSPLSHTAHTLLHTKYYNK